MHWGTDLLTLRSLHVRQQSTDTLPALWRLEDGDAADGAGEDSFDEGCCLTTAD